MPWGFLPTGCADAPFLEVLGLFALEFLEFEEEEFLRDAPLRTAGDGCATRVFKFFEAFFELGILIFFMRAGAGFIVTPARPFIELCCFSSWNKRPTVGVYY